MKDINYALMLIKAKKLAGAKEILEELLKADPRDKDILYNLGMCYTELGEPGRAVETLSECVSRYPDHANACVALGFAYARLGDNEKARDYFLKALEIDPANSYALRNLGGIYGNENNYEKASECFEKAFSLDPEDQQTAYGMGYAYFHAGKLAEADRYFEIAIALDESSKIAGLAKDLRRDIAGINLKSEGSLRGLVSILDFRVKGAIGVRSPGSRNHKGRLRLLYVRLVCFNLFCKIDLTKKPFFVKYKA